MTDDLIAKLAKSEWFNANAIQTFFGSATIGVAIDFVRKKE